MLDDRPTCLFRVRIATIIAQNSLCLILLIGCASQGPASSIQSAPDGSELGTLYDLPDLTEILGQNDAPADASGEGNVGMTDQRNRLDVMLDLDTAMDAEPAAMDGIRAGGADGAGTVNKQQDVAVDAAITGASCAAACEPFIGPAPECQAMACDKTNGGSLVCLHVAADNGGMCKNGGGSCANGFCVGKLDGFNGD